ncbi:MAG: hypothetical protein ACI9G1_000263 [Pirellulaceae bacterium]|jgi:hypothetical protein
MTYAIARSYKLEKPVTKKEFAASIAVTLLAICSVTLSGCGSSVTADTSATEESGISPQTFSDAVHAVMMADRTVYAKHVVTRLKKQESVVKPSEYWMDEDGTIPLPAQMFRMGSEIVAENPEAGFTYALKSKWPLNEQNKAKTPMEIEGLEYVAEHPGENFYGEETLGETRYFTAVYADTAVAQACWDCHNGHANKAADYPEFKKGDVMGGVIVRVPLP